MPRTNPANQRYVLGDWGTTRLRLYLVEDDALSANLEGPGVGALTSTPAETLSTLLQPWIPRDERLDVYLAGMVGSRLGLVEVPYAAVPADRDAWSCKAGSAVLGNLHITIAAGLRSVPGDGVPDVMRGEETQVFGAIRVHPALARDTHLCVLPGTHSKWVHLRDGSITGFRTVLTGELYALLRDRSTLLPAGGSGPDSESGQNEGFERGLGRSTHLAEGLPAALFEARAAQLLDQRSPAWAAGFVSGLLIGNEVSSLAGRLAGVARLHIIGEIALASLYQRAFAMQGMQASVLDGTACVIAGLRQLREWRRIAT